MIVFKLSMPHVGSWNGKWTQDDKVFARTYSEKKVPKELWNKSFYYRWDDGWTACVSVERMPASDARKIERRSNGFCGYDWMIRALIKDGYIHYERASDGKIY